MTEHKPVFSAPAPALSPGSRLGLGVYSALWYAALPGALAFKRLRSGLWPRLFSRPEPRETDVWIQAASAGECTLAQTLVQAWPEEKPVSCLATANTPQGMQVLDRVTPPRHMLYFSAYAPLDTGSRMRRTISALRPRVVVLLETELWPNLLAACAKANIPVLLLNARMTPKSLSWYSRNRALWAGIGPSRILAVDQEHASRYAYIFGQQSVGTMRNIKFDRWSDLHEPLPYVHNPLSGVFKAQSRLVVYGSVRTEEEPVLLPVLSRMASKHPRAVQAVFPRHMHRIAAWKNALDKAGLSWTLRSRVRDSVPQGTVVLWDCMGELEAAYALARSVFIGGSLAPKGGQNFLEPLAQGVVPCIGPWWSNFSWVGTEIVNQGLLTQVFGPEELVSALSQGLRSPQSRDKVHKRFAEYLGKRQGGTRDALAAIHQELK
ncbi:MAG: glycosyltransferase N-terminal domain-containing protein [Desulfovermiculus sp.]